MEALPAAGSSLRVMAPQREITKSAAAMQRGMSSMYSRTQMPSPFRGTPASRSLAPHALPAAFTGAVDVLVQALLVAAPQHVHHGAVDPLRPQAAAEGQNEGAIVQPQLPPGPAPYRR